MLKRFLVGSILIVVMTATATASSLLLAVGDLAAKLRCPLDTECGKIAEDLEPAKAGKPQTIMILGSDHRAGPANRGMPERSDTVILARLDPKKVGVGLLSLPRDLKVEIPGHGTDRLNAAYSIGGTRLTLKVVKRLLNIRVNHVVNVNFRGFKDTVNTIGCVYVDIDRRYYHSNAGVPPSEQYAEIDVQPGYQRMCGKDSLDYVRYRHTDNDLVRSARQQDYLRQARRQVSLSRLLEDHSRLIDIFADNTTSDIRKTRELLALIRLVLASAKQPIRQIHWRGRIGPSYVTSAPRQVKKVMDQFMGVRASKGIAKLSGSNGNKKKKRKRRKGKRGLRLKPTGAGLELAVDAGKQQAQMVAVRARMPVAYPRLRAKGSLYQGEPRVYGIRGIDGHLYRGVKMVLKDSEGEYYGVMETNWLDPPILKDPSEARRVNGRKLDLYYDGDRLRLVAWRTPSAVYWVSNTLLQSLSERQMLQITASLRRFR